ncbi:tripartite tricarboxylate transporter substrate binding protein [Bradyrhizobium sp. LHD-71]|uniref:Bug family tripartite tricarboxylate transporter substrate binding protein n=1 Tax=Bradyrhizobium sp. LHD-71 TaxID=3072141 RepID=UPI00280F716A|nr:tripartite tricarboxylate transporter substrate binding protein [Bradyrhizobium sp. LHD-71]MDQ8726229.1 tripartite tricarboxylate transporter substrate binding protein [Bradyrhizobium sp. LHD-71]
MTFKRTIAAVAVLLGIATATATAQDFPTRPVTWVVGFAPGGISDQGARMVAKTLGEKLGQPVIVENKPGAGGIVAAEYVAAAKPDGYTLLYAANGVMAANVSLYKKLSYDPLTSFTLIHGMGSSPLVLVVPASSPFKSLEELVAFAKKNAGKLTYASVGNGTAAHLTAELMSKHAGINMVHVPYRGSAPGMTDLLAGRVDLMFDYSIVVKPQIDGGKLRALAQTGAKRMVSHADVPTFGELGYPDVQFAAWATLVGPAGMPQPVVDKLATAFNATLKDPAIVKYHEEQGVALMPDVDAPKLKPFIVSETAKFKDLIERTGATAE